MKNIKKHNTDHKRSHIEGPKIKSLKKYEHSPPACVTCAVRSKLVQISLSAELLYNTININPDTNINTDNINDCL